MALSVSCVLLGTCCGPLSMLNPVGSLVEEMIGELFREILLVSMDFSCGSTGGSLRVTGKETVSRFFLVRRRR